MGRTTTKEDTFSPSIDTHGISRSANVGRRRNHLLLSDLSLSKAGLSPALQRDHATGSARHARDGNTVVVVER